MSLSVHAASVSIYEKLLAAEVAMIDKAVAFAEANNFAPGILFASRLRPDMWDFSWQIKAATNHVFRGTARLAGLPIQDMPEDVATEAAMKARIAATSDFIKGIDPAELERGLDREITFPMDKTTATMRGRDYFVNFSLPNVYFHHTTAYNILRYNGLPLSKLDYAGKI